MDMTDVNEAEYIKLDDIVFKIWWGRGIGREKGW
jgi:hypothetical protein